MAEGFAVDDWWRYAVGERGGLGRRVQEQREALGLSIAELSALTENVVHEDAISNLEAGHGRISSAATCEVLAEALQTTAGHLTRGIDERELGHIDTDLRNDLQTAMRYSAEGDHASAAAVYSHLLESESDWRMLGIFPDLKVEVVRAYAATLRGRPDPDAARLLPAVVSRTEAGEHAGGIARAALVRFYREAGNAELAISEGRKSIGELHRAGLASEDPARSWGTSTVLVASEMLPALAQSGLADGRTETGPLRGTMVWLEQELDAGRHLKLHYGLHITLANVYTMLDEAGPASKHAHAALDHAKQDAQQKGWRSPSPTAVNTFARQVLKSGTWRDAADALVAIREVSDEQWAGQPPDVIAERHVNFAAALRHFPDRSDERVQAREALMGLLGQQRKEGAAGLSEVTKGRAEHALGRLLHADGMHAEAIRWLNEAEGTFRGAGRETEAERARMDAMRTTASVKLSDLRRISVPPGPGNEGDESVAQAARTPTAMDAGADSRTGDGPKGGPRAGAPGAGADANETGRLRRKLRDRLGRTEESGGLGS